MLRIVQLELENFGPYKGRQRIDFPDRGVTIVYGENMRGKTSLLNSMRFALFGKVLGRGSKEASLHSLGNWEAAAAGDYGFEVSLRLMNQGTEYIITRSCHPRPGVDKPKADDDYVVKEYVLRDGDVLGPDEATSTIENLIPEQVSRFFLFDAELLQEYEDLLRSGSEMGRRISAAIERILGVPVLTDARTTVGRVRDEFESQEARAAQHDQLTRELGMHLDQLQEQRSVLQSELEDLRRDLESTKSRKTALEEEFSRRERVAAIIDERNMLRVRVAELDEGIGKRKEELRRHMSKAWRILLSPKLETVDDKLRDEERELELRRLRQEMLAGLTGDAAECPTCLRKIDDAARARLTEASDAVEGEAAEDEEHLRSIQRMRAALQEFAMPDEGRDVLKILWNDLHEMQHERHSKHAEASDLDDKLRDVDEKSLQNSRIEYERVVRELAALEDGIEKTRLALEANRNNAENIRNQIERKGGTRLGHERARRQKAESLHRLLHEAVDVYRDRLRWDVERDATELFLKLTTEPDYKSLSINENYGLMIVHQDGSLIPVRSAGAEHVVAMSLMGALQQNAPLRGPIIIDSPFGRLDKGHTTKMVRALPGMTEQTVLLVYEDELQPSLARSELRGDLKREYRMERISARHTELVRAIGG